MNSFCSLAVTLAISLGGSGAPPPSHELETVMQDDAELLARSHAEVRRNTRQMADLGVDRVRLTASWSLLAPNSSSKVRPRFDATDSRQYREETIQRLDWARTESKAAGMDVMIDLAFFAPRWGVKRSERPRRPVTCGAPRCGSSAASRVRSLSATAGASGWAARGCPRCACGPPGTSPTTAPSCDLSGNG